MTGAEKKPRESPAACQIALGVEMQPDALLTADRGKDRGQKIRSPFSAGTAAEKERPTMQERTHSWLMDSANLRQLRGNTQASGSNTEQAYQLTRSPAPGDSRQTPLSVIAKIL